MRYFGPVFLFGLLFFAAVFFVIGLVPFLITLAGILAVFVLCAAVANWGDRRIQAQRDAAFRHITSVRDELAASEKKSESIRVIGGRRGPDREVVR